MPEKTPDEDEVISAIIDCQNAMVSAFKRDRARNQEQVENIKTMYKDQIAMYKDQIAKLEKKIEKVELDRDTYMQDFCEVELLYETESKEDDDREKLIDILYAENSRLYDENEELSKELGKKAYKRLEILNNVHLDKAKERQEQFFAYVYRKHSAGEPLDMVDIYTVYHYSERRARDLAKIWARTKGISNSEDKPKFERVAEARDLEKKVREKNRQKREQKRKDYADKREKYQTLLES